MATAVIKGLVQKLNGYFLQIFVPSGEEEAIQTSDLRFIRRGL